MTLFLILSLLTGLFENKRRLRLVDDQVILASMVLKDMDSALYPRDPVLADRHYRLYSPPARTILAATTRITGEIEAGHRLVAPVLLFVFLTTFYMLLYSLTGHAPASGWRRMATTSGSGQRTCWA
ncbi:MAG: hypothetical protein L0332_01005 [Chloroflexi bacterium]|nr:hypothetical protein [Chloroflexota bacterium]MCI0725301.1 hypothetical protein [Chloroflexota bacterium]